MQFTKNILKSLLVLGALNAQSVSASGYGGYAGAGSAPRGYAPQRSYDDSSLGKYSGSYLPKANPQPQSYDDSGVADGQGTSYGYDALSVAVQNGNVANVQQLLAAGQFDVNAPASDGTTPLGWAVFKNNLPMVQVLVSAGADVNVKSAGHSPLYWSYEWADRYTDSDAAEDGDPYDQEALAVANSIGDFLTTNGAMDDYVPLVAPTLSSTDPMLDGSMSPLGGGGTTY